jgi:hypothetical protein
MIDASIKLMRILALSALDAPEPAHLFCNPGARHRADVVEA